MLTIRRTLLAAAAALTFSACADEAPPPAVAPVATPTVSAPTARALRVRLQRLPRIDDSRVRTRGSYPQLSGNARALGRVNAALREAMRAEQSRYVGLVRAHGGPPGSDPGLFELHPRVSLMSASSVVVSALIPMTKLMPGGNADGQGWLAVTLRTTTGTPVAVEELFTDPKAVLAVLAATVETQLVAENPCVRKSVENPPTTGAPSYRAGFSPTPSHYRHVALTPRGLVVGFPIERVASGLCNRVRTTVPYATLRPHLSALGRRLVDGVRRPRSSGFTPAG